MLYPYSISAPVKALISCLAMFRISSPFYTPIYNLRMNETFPQQSQKELIGGFIDYFSTLLL